MVRQKLKASPLGINPEFKNRGEEQTRIETFSDAVFALAVTLLVLSSTVPTTYDQLLESFVNIIPFGICITLLMMIWFQHYIFFIRYGFKDLKIVVINSFLLFLVLTYIYPLKFLFQMLVHLYIALIAGDQAALDLIFTDVIQPDQMTSLMVIYGLGAAAVFSTLGIMYVLAYKRRDDLKLTVLEVFHTKTNIYYNFLMAAVPLISVFFALVSNAFIAGISYWLYGLIMPLFGYLRRKKGLKLVKR
ncbi:TMEM175 family protein [Fulvivirga sp.]|uniref:TMEM175 family protein n=2 Tax=Fulvivirga sp. TaxID=1931237 RepID=UPI0032F077E2